MQHKQLDGEFPNGKGKGGFVDYEPPTNEQKCLNPAHNPPSHIVLKAGKHTYKCPSCGKITVINVPFVTF